MSAFVGLLTIGLYTFAFASNLSNQTSRLSQHEIDMSQRVTSISKRQHQTDMEIQGIITQLNSNNSKLDVIISDVKRIETLQNQQINQSFNGGK
jgi:hypothetical protein